MLLPRWHGHPPKWVRPWGKLHTTIERSPIPPITITRKLEQNIVGRKCSISPLSPFANTCAMYNSHTSDTQSLVLATAIRLILSLPRLSRKKLGRGMYSMYSVHASSEMARASSKVGQAICRRKYQNQAWANSLVSASPIQSFCHRRGSVDRVQCSQSTLPLRWHGHPPKWDRQIAREDWRQYVICKRGHLTGKKLTTTRCRYYVGQEVKLTRCYKTCRTILSIPRMTITQRKLEKRWKKYSTIRKHKCIICNASIQNSKKLSALMRNRESLFLPHRSTK